MHFKQVTHVLFDLDGLLLDTEKVYQNVIQEIAEDYGKIYTNDVKTKILGTIEQDIGEIAVSEMGLPITPTDFHGKFREMCQTALKNAPLMAGAGKLIRHLAYNNIPIAIVTLSSKENVEVKLKRYSYLFSLFNHKVMACSDSEVKHGKPKPDIFLVCASRFPDKPKPENCLVFEDTPKGVTAAIRAGMQVVMVPAPETDPALCEHATLVLNSLEDFLPELFGLPPF